MPANQPATQGNAPISGWTVTGQNPTVQTDASGKLVRGIEVFFRLPSGTGGPVFIPDAQYNPVNVRAAIAAKAGLMSEVDGLSG